MSDTSQGSGWWIAWDGKWYPPDLHPGAPQGSVQSTVPPDVAPPPIGESGHLPVSSPDVVIGTKKPGLPRAVVAGVAALVAVLLTIVLLIVTLGGAVVATELAAGSGTATVTIQLGGSSPKFEGAIGTDSFNGRVAPNSSSGTESPLSLSGTLGGTAFTLSVSPNTNLPSGTIENIGFNVSGEYGSQSVRGTLTWNLSGGFTSGQLAMTVHGTVGSRTLDATGSVSGNGPSLAGTFHYSIN